MAEERKNKDRIKDTIYVFSQKFVCENCKDWFEHIDPLDTPDCKNCEEIDFPHISRAESIEKMAKALYAHTWKSRTPMVRVQNWEIGVTDQNKKRYLGLAEAALNALLEE